MSAPTDKTLLKLLEQAYLADPKNTVAHEEWMAEVRRHQKIGDGAAKNYTEPPKRFQASTDRKDILARAMNDNCLVWREVSRPDQSPEYFLMRITDSNHYSLRLTGIGYVTGGSIENVDWTNEL